MVAGGRELIDTLWNVNFLFSKRVIAGTFELIDTLWNVNLFTNAFQGVATVN